MARPLIGITTYVTPAKWSYWDTEAALIPAAYVNAIERAGGRALLVPPSEDGVEETLQALDGLLFSGGSDLDPELYDQEPHEETFGVGRNATVRSSRCSRPRSSATCRCSRSAVAARC